MVLVKRLFNRLIKSYQPVQLGRWSIEYCPKILDTRVKLTNEDHCGTCWTSTDTSNISKRKNNDKMITTDKYIEMNMMESFNLADI